MRWLDEKNPKTTALSGAFGDLSFGELRQRVEESKNRDQDALPLLAAEGSPDFVARILARLETGKPFALVSPDLAPPERESRLRLLQNAVDPRTAVIVFTSGSTGAPKAVQLSAANLAANTEAVIDALDFAKAERQGLFLSLSYSYGLFGQLLPALAAGLPTRLYSRFAEVRADFAAGRGAGMWSGVPSHWEALLRVTEKCREVTHVISAGAAFSLDLRRRLRDHFPEAVLYNNYGLTECSPRVLSLSSRNPRFFEEGTVGFPVKGMQVCANADGELLVRGTQVMLGYLGDPAGTAERIREGWLHSGDAATIDPDGLVKILGRKDDLFNIGGERASPLEIDAALAALPGVKEAAVLVEAHELYGARLTAFLVLERVATRQELVEGLRKSLSGHKIPLEFYQVEALPRTANGKLRRAALDKLRENGRRL